MGQKVEREPAFESISVAEFFYRNRQMAGFGNSTQAVYSAVRELVENSLDSCEEAQNSPIIDICIDSPDQEVCHISVSDNGSGVPVRYAPEAFTRVLYGSKYQQRQKRGAFGLGVTMAVLYGQITTDSPVVVHTRIEQEEGVELKLLIDVEKNTPIVKSTRPLPRSSTGTTVSLRIKGDLKRAKDRIIEYLRLTSVSSPYARVSLSMDGETESFGGHSHDLPSHPIETKPHPRSTDLEMLRRISSGCPSSTLREWLVESFQKVGAKSAARFLDFMSLDGRQEMASLDREHLSRLAAGLRKYDGFEGPDSRSLSPIGKDSFIRGVTSVFSTSATQYATRTASEWDGHAFVVEAVMATGDDFPRSELPVVYRFANRVPLLYDASEDVLTRALRKVNWSRYSMKAAPPAALFVNLSSTRVPFKAAGKQSIDTVPSIEAEVIALYRDLGRKLRKVVSKRQRTTRSLRKQREFSRSFRLLAESSASLAGCEIPEIRTMIQRLFEVDDNA